MIRDRFVEIVGGGDMQGGKCHQTCQDQIESRFGPKAGKASRRHPGAKTLDTSSPLT